ncbi:MAG TPA: hypothetical protein VKT30_16760 [Caulobacteraceae bacterium]|nr:hypothetical protein [Caulobacteraceae bacterium]
MHRTRIRGRIVLIAAALLGVALGLILPTAGLHGGREGRQLTPGYSAS